MSTSAASRLLSGLERATGLVLFSRDRQRLRPTAEGVQYFNDCYRVLVAMDDLPRAARRLASGARARLRLVSTPRLISSQNRPRGRIDLQSMFWHELAHLPLERSFDVGLAALPLKNAALETESLFAVPVSAVMRSADRLAKRGSVRPSELISEPLIGTAAGGFLREEVEELFADDGVAFRPQVTVATADHACEFALRMNAVALAEPLISWIAEPYALVPVKPLRMFQFGIAVPALKPDSRLVTKFRECLREEAATLRQRLASQFKGKLKKAIVDV